MRKKQLFFYRAVLYASFSIFVFTGWFKFSKYNNERNNIFWRRALRLDPRTVVLKKKNIPSRKDIIVMVMGEASAFQQWYQVLKDIDANLSFVFASYDEDASKNNIVSNDEGFDYSTIFIPSKTWTQGRNLLAEEALYKEKLREKEYDYWLFLDDDVEPICHEDADKVLGEGSCWQKVFNFFSSDNVPEKATSIVMSIYFNSGFTAASNADAFFAAFKREYIPYVMPYATLEYGASEWISQACIYCLMATCMPISAVYVPYVRAHNAQHRGNYIVEGFDIPNINKTLQENYYDEKSNFYPCSDWDSLAYFTQGEIGGLLMGPFKTGDELNKHITQPASKQCAPISKRFAKWKKTALSKPREEKIKPTTLKNDNSITVTSKISDVDILVMVAGGAESFRHWYELLNGLDANLSFIYGSFDQEAATDFINANQEFDYKTVLMQSKTWTEGRNMLAEEAIRKENIRGKEYSYWLFLDEYTEPACEPEADKILGDGSCWQKIFNFLSSDAVPEKASTVALPWRAKAGFASTSNVDIMYAAFRREYVPYLFPYATLQKGASEWISQAANFCLVTTCAPYSSVFVPYVNTTSTNAWRLVAKGYYDIESIQSAITTNYHIASSGFLPCQEWSDSVQHYTMGELAGFVAGPYDTPEELNQHIPDPNLSVCVSLNDRFDKWKGKILLTPSNQGNSLIPLDQGNDISNIAVDGKKDIIVMIMGEAFVYEQWYELLKDIDANLSFVYASYDKEVTAESDSDLNDKEFDSKTIFIPSTTWTEGRNLLAEEALRKEKERGKEYSYWLFADDDIKPECAPEAEILGDGSCWQKIFNFILSDAVPARTSTITLPWHIRYGFSSVSSPDAMFAAFNREYVPYLLPYATLKEGTSQWISQAANFCLEEACMRLSSVFVPFAKADNTKSRPYIREGFDYPNIRATIEANYFDEAAGFYPCNEWKVVEHFIQGELVGFLNGPYNTTEELSDSIPEPNFIKCVTLKDRFVKWSENVVTNR